MHTFEWRAFVFANCLHLATLCGPVCAVPAEILHMIDTTFLYVWVVHIIVAVHMHYKL